MKIYQTKIALSSLPKDKPWYKILVHNAFYEAYVTERYLTGDSTTESPIN